MGKKESNRETKESGGGGRTKSIEADRVLVVSRAGPTLRLIRDTLSNFTTARIDTSPDAVYGFEMALQRRYKLFIFSFSMPALGGEMLYELISKAYRYSHEGVRTAPAVVYLCEKDESMGTEHLARDARVKGILLKPVNIDRLLTTVDGVLTRKDPA